MTSTATRPASSVTTAALLAFLVPSALYGSALIAQFGFGLHPCEMCYWQRWPHQAAIILGLLAIILRRHVSAARILTLLAALAVLASGMIGLFHWGVEQGFWQGLTSCSTGPSGPISLNDIMAAPVIRCDVPQWTFMGLSMAAMNMIMSWLGAALILRWWKIGGTSV